MKYYCKPSTLYILWSSYEMIEKSFNIPLLLSTVTLIGPWIGNTNLGSDPELRSADFFHQRQVFSDWSRLKVRDLLLKLAGS